MKRFSHLFGTFCYFSKKWDGLKSLKNQGLAVSKMQYFEKFNRNPKESFNYIHETQKRSVLLMHCQVCDNHDANDDVSTPYRIIFLC